MAKTTAKKNDQDELIERLHGHDRIEVEGDDGTKYTVRFTRERVMDMEDSGVTAQSSVRKMSDGTLSGVLSFVRDFVAPAFEEDQPGIEFEKVLAVYESLPDKDEFVSLLIGLFMLPTLTLTTDPTETRAKFRLV